MLSSNSQALTRTFTCQVIASAFASSFYAYKLLDHCFRKCHKYMEKLHISNFHWHHLNSVYVCEHFRDLRLVLNTLHSYKSCSNYQARKKNWKTKAKNKIKQNKKGAQCVYLLGSMYTIKLLLIFQTIKMANIFKTDLHLFSRFYRFCQLFTFSYYMRVGWSSWYQ